MAQHRTKEQKKRADQHRSLAGHEPQVFTYKDTGSVRKVTPVQKGPKEIDLTQYTKGDLIRTGIISIILLAILVGIFQYLRYNG